MFYILLLFELDIIPKTNTFLDYTVNISTSSFKKIMNLIIIL